MTTDARDIAFVKRRLWLPRICNDCLKVLWLVRAFVRLRPGDQAVQVLCRTCGVRRLV